MRLKIIDFNFLLLIHLPIRHYIFGLLKVDDFMRARLDELFGR